MPKKRFITITTPLADKLLFVKMQGTEALGRLFSYQVTLYSTDEDIKLNDILGQNVTINLKLTEGGERYFNGYISRFWQEGRTESGYAVYYATISPWLWFLSLTADCRIFQEKNVPDIIKEVFNDNGFSDFEDALIGDYPPREYCVQYRESDFNFVSRLMENEGIYYYFKHEDGKHKLVLADAYSSHEAIGGEPVLPYHLPGSGQTVRKEHVAEWRLNGEIQSSVCALGDYNFKTPKNKLLVQRIIERSHAQSSHEVFDYPGGYPEADIGDQYALERIEELQASFEQVSAQTDARNMITGGLFTLEKHPRADQNREYLVISAMYTLCSNEYLRPDETFEDVFQCDFAAIESKQTVFRPERSTHCPFVQGPQTAVVVGPSGEEIYPDEYGRIKVQFHWDRYGTMDENSSCWIRVAQTWAGTEWGAQFIPRIGHEVMVDFLEGDPDRPIITGRVYNADNMPPYSLPNNKTQSGIKSRSSPDGSASNFNEIRMEDKKDSEEFYVQAEKDYNQLVKNDRGETIGHDRSLSVGHDKSEAVANDKSITVGANHSETIAVNKSLNVGGNHSEGIGGNMTITVAQNVTETIAINYAETVGAAMELTVGGFMAESIGAYKTQNIGVDKSESIGSNKSVTVGKNTSEKVGDSKSLNVGKNFTTDVGDSKTIKVGKNFTLDAGDEITIKTGKASINMKKDGTITISGKDITVDGKGAINIKASKDIVMKGKKILQN